MLTNLLVAGIGLLLAAYAWDLVFPANKKIWTSSYTLLTTGLAMLTLGVLIYAIEFKERQGAWSKFFDVFGKNPLFIFVLSGFLPRLVGLFRWQHGVNEAGKPQFTNLFDWFYDKICAPLSTDPRTGSLVYALALILFYWAIVYILDKKRIYIKV
jgi:predicted acyltransferase